jgi:AhpD family alkylhydroperoxidase
MTKTQDLIEELREPTRELRHLIPDTWSAFTQLHASALADGELSAEVKELMALSISVVQKCDGCIAHHADRVARHGATPEAVAESLAVALLMDGGPATVYAPRAWQAYQESLERRSLTAHP